MLSNTNETIIEGSISLDEQDNNNMKTTEGYILLELMEEIKRLCRDIEEGLITISFDNKYLMQKVTVVEKEKSKCIRV